MSDLLVRLGVDETRRPLLNIVVLLRSVDLVPDRLDPGLVIYKSLLWIRDFEQGAHLEMCVVIIRVELNDPFKQLDRLYVIVLGARLSCFDLGKDS